MNSPPEPPGAAESTQSGRKSNTLAVLLGVAIAGIVIFIIGSVKTIVPRQASPAEESLSRIRCLTNLRKIGNALVVHSRDHAGTYPDALYELILEELPSTALVCPDSNDTPAAGADTGATAANVSAGGHLSYIYLGKGLTYGTALNKVLVYEPITNHHNEGMTVLFGDGHIEWMEARRAAKCLAELNAGHNPPRAEAVK